MEMRTIRSQEKPSGYRNQAAANQAAANQAAANQAAANQAAVETKMRSISGCRIKNQAVIDFSLESMHKMHK